MRGSAELRLYAATGSVVAKASISIPPVRLISIATSFR
jgi:hypothetical protein